jgi:Holliday junction resolvase RusA-like endonuclease
MMPSVDLTTQAVEIVVTGRPQPGGSKTAIPIKRGDRYLHDKQGRPLVQVVDANPKAKAWRKRVAKVAAEQYTGEPIYGPMIVSIDLFLHRWKNHYGTGKNVRMLRDDAPQYPTGDHPDADKLARPILDGMTGVVYEDDALVVDLVVSRRYVDGYSNKNEPGAERAVVRVMQHLYPTVAEHRLGGQLTLA